MVAVSRAYLDGGSVECQQAGHHARHKHGGRDAQGGWESTAGVGGGKGGREVGKGNRNEEEVTRIQEGMEGVWDGGRGNSRRGKQTEKEA